MELNKCNECDYKCTRPENLKKHIRFVHAGIADFKCQKCDNEYKSRSELTSHMTRHEGLKIKCTEPDCNKLFKSKKALKLHVQILHEGVRHFCDQCDFKTTMKCYLKDHINSVHAGVKQFCQLCDYKANSKGTLYAHMSSKHGERSSLTDVRGPPFFCSQCDFKTTAN